MKHDQIAKVFNEAYAIHKAAAADAEPELEYILFRYLATKDYEKILFDVYAWYKTSRELARNGSDADWNEILNAGKVLYEHYTGDEFCKELVSFFLDVLIK